MCTESTNGPQSSKLANKLDPRVDSDSDKDSSIKSELGDARNYGKGRPARKAGPYSYKFANEIDPRLDPDQGSLARNEPEHATGP